jgi:ABC-type lipoprotein export system ATPase subunit
LFKNFNGYWSNETASKPALQNINIHFRRGKFYGICGKVGSGKSSILSVILE